MEIEVKNKLKKALGVFLVIFGILGLILPILPGVWVIPIGLELLGWRLIIDRKKPWSEMIKLRDKTKEPEQIVSSKTNPNSKMFGYEKTK